MMRIISICELSGLVLPSSAKASCRLKMVFSAAEDVVHCCTCRCVIASMCARSAVASAIASSIVGFGAEASSSAARLISSEGD